ncbi:MAG: anti-sigma factor [Prosthecobacter sp.]|jgi:anti-sigma-K factor RskA|uniref:anti-sigma factor domain-containing protein n=1 Tax=Prosthecobacter sp. TaxID=1965333 RepID=UPI001A101C8F|nr:anti-sigma factor [Prosthecobacter sp.]MBE2285394.1 anti-sigma factor [Prosthecobacter sp.]
MDPRSEELAALNALGMLESDEKRVLDGSSLVDRELRDLNAELELVAAELGRLVVPVEPPADMKRRIRAKIRSRGGSKLRSISPLALIAGVGWAAAVALALASIWLWRERASLNQQFNSLREAIAPVTQPTAEKEEKEKPPARNLEEELKKLRGDFESQKTALNTEIEALRKREADANAKVAQLVQEAQAQKERDAAMKLHVATLQSEIWEYRRSVMTIVWDASKDQGALMLDKMPRVESGRDYQLWIIDPQKPDPVSGGVLAVDDKGTAKTTFKSTEDVGDAVKFIVSVEKKGGVPKKEGEVVLKEP